MPDKQDIRESISEYWKTGNTRIALVVILAISVFSAPFVAENVFVKTQNTDLPASAEVIPRDNKTNVGASADTGKSLEFGRVENNIVNITKTFTVSLQDYDPDRYFLTRVSVEGNISEFLVYREEHTFSGRKDVSVKFAPTRVGNYSGVVHVKVQAANNQLGEQWLKLKSRLW